MDNSHIKLPPQNLEAEQTILGAMLKSKKNLDLAATYLIPEDFYDKRNGVIFEFAINLDRTEVPVDYITITEVIRTAGKMEDAGGISYISTEILSAYLPGENLFYYIEIVKNKSKFREIQNNAGRIIEDCYKTETPLSLEPQIESMKRIAEPIILPPVDRAAALAQNRADMRAGKLKGMSTKIDKLNRELAGGGWVPGRFYVIGAYTSHGKTGFALNQATRLADDLRDKDGRPILYVNLEMTEDELNDRQRAIVCGIPYFDIGFGMKADQWEAIERADGIIADLNIVFMSRSSLTMLEVGARCRKINPKMVIIDYLQRMELLQLKGETREIAVARGARYLKTLAMEIHAPVLALSQLHRKNENSNNPPRQDDLRESGAIGQDADLAMFLWDRFKATGKGEYDQVTVNIDKQRGGPVGMFTLGYDKTVCQFSDLRPGSGLNEWDRKDLD